jgi:hypothetical protein
MKNSCNLCLKDNRSFLWATLPFMVIFTLVILGASVEAFGENSYYNIHKANFVEDSWDRKAQGMAKIVSIEDGNRILIIENFVTNSEQTLDVYFTSENDLEKRILLGEINTDSKIHFYPIPKDVKFSEYNTILITEKLYFLIYGKAIIF